MRVVSRRVVIGGAVLVVAVAVLWRFEGRVRSSFVPGVSDHPHPSFVVASQRARTDALGRERVQLPWRTLSASGLPLREARDESPRVLGSFGGAAYTSGGRLALLDPVMSRVLIFDSTGTLRSRFGREGEGPGEFKGATAIAVGSADEIAVADLGGRVQFFEARADGSYSLTRTIRPARSVRSMCFLGDRLIVSGAVLGDGHTIAVLRSSNGELVASFGEVYKSPNPLVNAIVSEGRVACDPAGQRVLFATKGLIGEIRAYSIAGRMLWRTSLAGFRANTLRDTEDGFTLDRSSEGVNALHTLIFVSDVGLLAQYSARSTAELKERVGGRADHTLVIDPQTGESRESAEMWPLVAAVHRGVIAAIAEEPVPSLWFGRLSASQ